MDTKTRPDIVFEISQIAQKTGAMYEKDISKHCKRLSRAIEYVHDHKVYISIPRLNCNSSRVTANSGIAFANNANLSSRLGRIVLLTDDTHNYIPLSCKSYKSLRVARSVLSAQVIAMTDLFDNALAIRKQL